MLLCSLPSLPRSSSATLDIVFQLESAQNRGTLRIALFNSEAGFADDEPYYGTSEVVSGRKEISISVSDLPSGTYALAAFHDRNGNEKLDRNIFGVPNEAYGFIQEPASKWRAPRWEEISLEIGDQDLEVQVEIKKWSDR